MNHPASPHSAPQAVFYLALAAALAVVAIKAIVFGPEALDSFVSAGNDDVMRLMSVRSWLAGQSWFDMTQYRLLPPEGVSLHWSRYVDLGIGAIVWTAALMLPMDQAEVLAVTLWPSLLMSALILVTGFGTRRVLGPVAAGLAMASLLLWAVTGTTYFSPGRLDHHNVQILLLTILAFAMALPGPALRRGTIAGAASGLSLAVGLEGLFFIAAAGLTLAARAVLDYPQAQRLFTSFGVALGASALLLFVGQTAPAEWLVARCDELSTPFLSIAAVGTLATLAVAAAHRVRPHPAARLAALVAIALPGLWLIRPLLIPCLDGPYGDLPETVQRIIATQIVEAIPGLTFALQRPLSFNGYVTPALAAVLLSSIFWLRRRGRPDADAAETDTVRQMVLLGWIGLLACLLQIRMILMVAPALPFLTGYVLHRLLARRLTSRSTASALALVGAVIPTLLAPALNPPVEALVGALRGPAAAASLRPGTLEKDCRTRAIISALDTLPPSRVLTTMNLGPVLVLTTHHTGLSAPYHRSAQALSNGILPFQQDQDGLRRTLAVTGARYLVLCRGAFYGTPDSLASRLAAGAQVDWLAPVELGDSPLLVFDAGEGAT